MTFIPGRIPIRTDIKKDLGEFPFFGFWGPAAGVKTPQGAAGLRHALDCRVRQVDGKQVLARAELVYLPHLDYNLQRHGTFQVAANVSSRHNESQPRSHECSHELSLNPQIVPDLRAMDDIAGDLIQFFETRGVGVVLLSEYGITNVDTPVHLNRIFREQGWLTVKDELGLEVLDAGASQVFAVADHQVAHIYLNDRTLENPVREVLEKTPGVDRILGEGEKTAAGIAHPRAGDLIAVAAEHAWFTYYYWLEDARAPDFARTVDIHRKPGYDPVELFLDPKITLPQLKIAWRLLQKKTGASDADGCDSAGRHAGEGFAWPAAGAKKRLAGVHHQPA